MREYLHFIDNSRRAASDGRTVAVVEPATGEPFALIARGNARDVDLAVAAARRAIDGERTGLPFRGAWGRFAAAERGRLLARLSAAVAANQDELAELESRDTGKPMRQARADALALARYFEFYAGAADKLHGQTLPYQNGYTVLTLREPHGVTGHIIPWNYPMQIFGRSVGAALAAGNACVVKPAEDACLSLLRVAELAAQCDLPAGALNIVTGLGAEAGQALAEHPGIDHISFTGSGPTGERVSNAAAAHCCPVTLELGGKSAQVVFADADLDAAVPVIVNAIIQNCGQTCSAGSRVLVARERQDELAERLGAAFKALVTDTPQADADLGPLINARQRDRVSSFLAQAERDGLPVLATGRLADGLPANGYYQPAVLLGRVPIGHAVAQQEVFGPVLAMTPFEHEDDAIALANATPYGLVAGVWTADGARQMRMARAVRTGQVFINNYGAGGGVELPFGGMKHSGFGREKGFEALYGFTTLKTIAVRHD
ncbi:MAG: aldehyde dehydrogenase family protein [Burkholderiaceae bacterium]